MVFKVIFVVCCLTYYVSAHRNDNLVAVLQIFRHGARSPTNFYPSDPYSNIDKYWDGLTNGQLTNEGKLQQFKLGEFSRRRYGGWLPTRYSNKVLHAQTTDVDRTHMSAQSNLRGLFPAKGNQVWLLGESWQPIPVHVADSRILDTLNSNCTSYLILIQNTFKEKEFQELDNTYADVYKYISTYAKMNVTSFFNSLFVFDPLHVEHLKGYKLPSWTSKIYPEPLMKIATKAFQGLTYNDKMKRLGTGTFLNTIVEYFEAMIKDPNSLAKYQIFSAHDSNLFNILNTIGQTPSQPISFATSLWFELRKANGVHIVNLWMKSGSDVSQISISGCPLDCPVSTMKTLLSPFLLDVNTFVKECNILS